MPGSDSRPSTSTKKNAKETEDERISNFGGNIPNASVSESIDA